MIESNCVFPPCYGESILLLCTKCKKTFIGPNPRKAFMFGDIFKNVKPAKCPQCGSKKVVPRPFINY